MDTTKEYIKMCEKAKEIQKSFQSLHDTINHPHNLYIDRNTYKVESFNNYKHRNNIWLPRQDQLQEMVSSRNAYNLMLIFELWYDKHCGDDSEYEYGSMEQLWLAFVMKEKYQKQWDGEKWTR